MALKQALRDLDAAVTDLLSLHVQTYSGSAEMSKNGIDSFDTLRAALKPSAGGAAATVKLDVTLMLETLIKFDGDSYNFVAKDGVTDELFKLHKDAIDSGLKTRLGLVEMMKNLLT